MARTPSVIVAVVSALVGLAVSACAPSSQPTPTEAAAFLDEVNETMLRLGIQTNQAGWVQQNFITEDTEALSARTSQQYIDAVARFAKASSTTCRPKISRRSSTGCGIRSGRSIASFTPTFA